MIARGAIDRAHKAPTLTTSPSPARNRGAVALNVGRSGEYAPVRRIGGHVAGPGAAVFSGAPGMTPQNPPQIHVARNHSMPRSISAKRAGPLAHPPPISAPFAACRDGGLFHGRPGFRMALQRFGATGRRSLMFEIPPYVGGDFDRSRSIWRGRSSISPAPRKTGQMAGPRAGPAAARLGSGPQRHLLRCFWLCCAMGVWPLRGYGGFVILSFQLYWWWFRRPAVLVVSLVVICFVRAGVDCGGPDWVLFLLVASRGMVRRRKSTAPAYDIAGDRYRRRIEI